MERDLNNPGLRSASRRVKEFGLLENLEKCFLDDLFCFTVIAQYAKCNTKHESGVSLDEKIQDVRVICVETSHQLFVTGTSGYGGFRHANRTCSTTVPNEGKGRRAYVGCGAHSCFSILPGILETVSECIVESERSQNGPPMPPQHTTPATR